MRTRLFLAMVMLAAACSRSRTDVKPVASLPSTPEAAVALQPLRAHWEERRQDPVALESYLKRFPEDGAAPLVKVYLA